MSLTISNLVLLAWSPYAQVRSSCCHSCRFGSWSPSLWPVSAVTAWWDSSRRWRSQPSAELTLATWYFWVIGILASNNNNKRLPPSTPRSKTIRPHTTNSASTALFRPPPLLPTTLSKSSRRHTCVVRRWPPVGSKSTRIRTPTTTTQTDKYGVTCTSCKM